MITTLPITFDRTIQIHYSDGSSENSNCFPASRGRITCNFNSVNGYDENNNRITNLVGFDGSSLLKRCPRCQQTKIVTEFGYSGRVTNSRRDQSNCSACRGSYN